MLSKPSDIGFSDDGYILPPMNVIEDYIVTEKKDNGALFNDMAVSATDFHKELRRTIKQRLEELLRLLMLLLRIGLSGLGKMRKVRFFVS